MGKAKRNKQKSPPPKPDNLQQSGVYRAERVRVEKHVLEALREERSAMSVVRLALAAQRTCQDTAQSFPPETLACLACQSGCDYCCYPPVSAAVPEVANIVAYVLSQLPEEEQQRLIDRVGQVYTQVNPMTGQERASTNVACPYLNQGKCSIYPVRPLSCRGFNSGSKEACQTVYEQARTDLPIPAFLPLLASAQGLKEGLLSGLKQAGLKNPLVDLVRASHKLFEELEDNLDGWLGGQDVFADCQPFQNRSQPG